MVEIGEGKTTDALAKSLSDGGPPEERTARLSEAKRTLYDALGLPETVRRVTISPYESVVFVPFAALDPTRSFAYVPSATTRVVLAKQRVEPGRRVLALGNPDYSVRGVAPAPGGPVALRGGTLTPLPGSGEEAKAVGDVVLLAKDATETVLSEKLAKQPRWHAVHFACHGLVDDQRPMRSALAVTPDASSDGMLSVLEIYRMQVASDLVVLSACESGRGRVAGSEGVVGFTGAFLLAGADRVIASLWKVDDEATRALMTKFYEVWKGGKTPTADALRIAQDHVRSQPKWADPRYWAAWQLWGLPD
jgi:CHAT domain-containing protein